MLTPTSGTLADYLSAVLAENEINARLVFHVQNITLDGNDIAADGGIVLNSILNSDTDLQMGKAVMTECVVHLLNGSKFTSFDWTEEFELQMGVSISGTTNWVTVGYFTGSKPEKIKRKDIIEFTAYDRMGKFDTLADGFISSLTFPLTMAQIYSALCTYIGITAESGDEIADVMAFSFSENPFMSGMTCRGILAAIAEANCCYARIAANGKVKLKWFSDQTSVYSVTGDDYFSVNVDEDAAPAIDYVRVGCTYDDEVTGFVYPVGVSGEAYQILDNPFLLNISTADLTTACTSIYNRLSAFGSYYPMSIDIVGNWMVETGDIIEVDIDGDAYSLPIFVRSLRWNGGCDDSYECTGRATRSEVSESAKEQYETGGKMANKYTIRSGVDITDEGVTISGGKYLKLISGGVLDVQSANFTISSEDGTVSSGNWVFYDDGLDMTKSVTLNPYEVDAWGDITYLDPKTMSVSFNVGKSDVVAGSVYDFYIAHDYEVRGYVNIGSGVKLYDNEIYPALKIGMHDNRSGIAKKDKFSSLLSVKPKFDSFVAPTGYTNDFIGSPFIIPDKDKWWSIGIPPSVPGDTSARRFATGAFVRLFTDYIEASQNAFESGDAVSMNTAYVDYDDQHSVTSDYSIWKCGSFIMLTLELYIKTAITSLTRVATCPYKPLYTVWTTAMTSQSTPAIAAAQLQTNGNIRMRSASVSSNESTRYYMTFMFIADLT